jgi:type II secretory pathway component PulM
MMQRNSRQGRYTRELDMLIGAGAMLILVWIAQRFGL